MKKWIALSALIGLLASCGGSSVPSNKKEIMDRFVAGTLDPSYAPAAFFVHFAPDQKVGDAAVEAHLKYFRETDMDIMKVQFEQTVPRIGSLDEEVAEYIPEDFYRPTLEVISKIQENVGEEAYVLPTLYSVFQVARQSLGDRRIMEAAVNQPEKLKAVLGSYEKALLWLIRECKAVGIEGFYTCTQGGEMKFYGIPGFFDTFVKPYDLSVMQAANLDTKMNILHICNWEGAFDDLTRFADYPGQIVNTPNNLNGTPFTLEDGLKLFGRPVLGGFDRQGDINAVTPALVADMTRDILASNPKGRVMVGADCTVSSAPLANIRTAVAIAHGEHLEFPQPYPLPDRIIDLWPDGAPTDNGLTGPEKDYGNHVSNVTKPTLGLYLPEKPNGLALLVCPGGGYVDVWDKTEGYANSKWYTDQGIFYAVLKYRLPNGHPEVPQDDVHEAMRILRELAGEYGFTKIGIAGCSAGGHLAATISTHYTKPEERPDFQILFYPVISLDPSISHAGSTHYLLGQNPTQAMLDEYSNEKKVTPDTPPAFLMANSDDALVPCENSIRYYEALRANGVSAALHIYPEGGHGWADHLDFVYRDAWKNDLGIWLSRLAETLADAR